MISTQMHQGGMRKPAKCTSGKEARVGVGVESSPGLVRGFRLINAKIFPKYAHEFQIESLLWNI